LIDNSTQWDKWNKTCTEYNTILSPLEDYLDLKNRTGNNFKFVRKIYLDAKTMPEKEKKIFLAEMK
jgi:hypothetical protein